MAANRNRGHEATEQRRAQLRAQGRCIGCEQPSPTYRCAGCRAEADANDTRYRGQGRPGRVSLIAANMSDMRYAVDALQKAWTGHAELERLGAMSPRRRAELLAEPIAQVHLCWKFCHEVLVRVGYLAAASTRRKPARSASARSKRRGHARTPAIDTVDPHQLRLPW